MTTIRSLALLALCCVLTSGVCAQLLPVPLRINMGGPELPDSRGRIWLGDGPGAGDPLDIRVDDAGGANTLENWCVAESQLQADSLEALGFDAFDPNDQAIFNTIRYDTGADGIDFRLGLPLPNGAYTVNLYFTECCCAQRHFKIESQGEIVFDDVSLADYDPVMPAPGRTGRLTIENVVVDNEILELAFLPCPECPVEVGQVVDINAIVDAIEVLSGLRCDQFGLDLNCSFDPATGQVTGTWRDIDGADTYTILKNGAPFGDPVPAGVQTFSDPDPTSDGPRPRYTVQASSGDAIFAECDCSVDAVTCIDNLRCEVTPGVNEVALLWDPAAGIEATGIEVRRNGQILQTLPPTASAFEDEPEERFIEYSVTLVTDPPGRCAPLTCSVTVDSQPFATPLRINMGGPELVDSLGRRWLADWNPGDPNAADPLGLRVDPGGGTNSIRSWCALEPESVRKVGLDPTNAADLQIMSTIRWDVGADGIDFELEIPVASDEYIVNLYFAECCCPARHFKVELEGEVVDEDVSYLDYDAVPATTKLGRLSFSEVEVADDSLSIALRPCPDCPINAGEVLDINAIISAIEVIPPIDCDENPDIVQCPSSLQCETNASRDVSLRWSSPICVDIVEYQLTRDGELIATLPGGARSYNDTITQRVSTYELTTVTAEGEIDCAPVTCVAECACPTNVQCFDDGLGSVTMTWDPPGCDDLIESYEVLLNGAQVTTLPGTAIDFVGEFESRAGVFTIVPVLPDGQDPCSGMTCEFVNFAVAEFDVPLRLNMGGPSAVDSRGRHWLGDQTGPGDFLDIRIDDLGGTNTIINWCVPLSEQNADSMQSLGLDPFNASDQIVFNTIRWDVGDDDGDLVPGELADLDGGDIDFRLGLPIEDGEYQVNMYFTECCCVGRHFQIEIEENLVAEDVSLAAYSGLVALGRTGRLSFDNISVGDGELSINIRPCSFDCPDTTDFNAIVDAIEVVPAGTLVQTCPRDLICSVEPDRTVRLEWSAGENVTVEGYELFRDGELLASLPGDATTYSDDPGGCRVGILYELVPTLQDGESFCNPDLRMTCSVTPCFPTPIRVNMGGPELIDSLGRTWLGDGGGDPLGIRPNPSGGANEIVNWCPPNADSVTKLGFDPTNPADLALLSSLRWDPGADAFEYRLEFSVENGTYATSLYFLECCCPTRHFSILIEEEVVDDDVSYLDYDELPETGKAGVLTFEDIEVTDGSLSIVLLPCFECPGSTNGDSILNAVEVVAGTPPPDDPVFVRGDVDHSGTINISDAVRVFGFLFLGDGDLPCFDAADFSDDGQLNLTDGVSVLFWLFQNGPMPAEPQPSSISWFADAGKADCGRDETPDVDGDLGCASYPICD